MEDVIIIGGGPAGMSAAIYTARRALKTSVITKDIGGQVLMTDLVENYPGMEPIRGFELAQKLKNQAEKFGAKVISAEAIKIEKKENIFTVFTSDNKSYQALAVILAFGLTPRNLDIPGEKEFLSRGVSYCVNCDGPLFKDKVVAVIGGGNAALDGAEYLSRMAKKVYLIHRRDVFVGDETTVELIKNTKNIELILNTEVLEIKGDHVVQSIVIAETNNKEIKKDLIIDGVFVEIGRIAKSDFVRDLVECDERGQIKTDFDGETNIQGIFSCGDITDNNYKQIVIAAGEGAKTALTAYQYIAKQTGRKATPDWGKQKH